MIEDDKKKIKSIISVVSSSGKMLTSRSFLEVFLHALVTCSELIVLLDFSPLVSFPLVTWKC